MTREKYLARMEEIRHRTRYWNEHKTIENISLLNEITEGYLPLILEALEDAEVKLHKVRFTFSVRSEGWAADLVDSVDETLDRIYKLVGGGE